MSHPLYELDNMGDRVLNPITSEGSLIFERNVEDPYTQVYSNPTVCSYCSNISRSNSVVNIDDRPTKHQERRQPIEVNPCKHVTHRNIENLIPPLLDEGANLVTNENADLDNVEMVYSRRPSTIGLDLALGRTRTNSFTDSHFAINNAPRLTGSVGNISQGCEPVRILRFYSYADMLSDENPNPRRPSISQSLSSGLFRQPTQHDNNTLSQPLFSNPFLSNNLRGEQFSTQVMAPQFGGPLRRLSSNGFNTRSSNSNTRHPQSPLANIATDDIGLQHTTGHSKKFRIDSSSSECSASDDEFDNEDNPLTPASPSSQSPSTLLNQSLGSNINYNTMIPNNNDQGHTNKVKSYSNIDMLDSTLLSRGSVLSKSQNLDNLLYDENLHSTGLVDSKKN